MQLHLKEWAELPSTLLSIENEEDRKEVTEKLIAQHPQIGGMLDSLQWMRKWTKTQDEQDPANPYKHFPPEKDYHRILHLLWEREPVLFVEKSRTMMTSWWAVAECTHFVETHPPALGIFIAQDQDRAVKCIDYARVLWDQQDEWLKRAYPLARPLDQQMFTALEWANGAQLLALPGKDPDKIRGYHPWVIFFDEAAFIDRFAETYSAALFTKAKKILAVTTAHPGDFRDMTRTWVEEPVPREWLSPASASIR